MSPKKSISYRKRETLVSNVGVEELGHLEMIGAIVYQLTRNLSIDEIKKAGFDAYFTDHTTGVYPTAASGAPYSAFSMQVKGDVIADLHEDLAAEQKARVTYDNLLRLIDDPDVRDPIKFLREREVVHYQRFGDTRQQSCNFFVCFMGRMVNSAHIFRQMFQMISILESVA